jgi:hypothetical protein
MPRPKEIRNELSGIRRRFLEMLVPLQTREDVQRDPESEEDRLRRALWKAAQELDHLLNEGKLPEDLDLTTNDPSTQRLLYASVVRDHFSVKLLDDEGDVDVPRHTPEECGLQVFFQYGRYADSRIMPSGRHWPAANA